MDEQLAANAKTLARWCYARGIDERILECGENLLRSAVDQALGRAAPLHLESLLWLHTAALLGQDRKIVVQAKPVSVGVHLGGRRPVKHKTTEVDIPLNNNKITK